MSPEDLQDLEQGTRQHVVDLLANRRPGQLMYELLAEAEQVTAFILDGTVPEPPAKQPAKLRTFE